MRKALLLILILPCLLLSACGEQAQIDRETVDQVITAENDYYSKNDEYTKNIATLRIDYPELNALNVDAVELLVEDDLQGVLVEVSGSTNEGQYTFTATARDGLVIGRSCKGQDDHGCNDRTWTGEGS